MDEIWAPRQKLSRKKQTNDEAATQKKSHRRKSACVEISDRTLCRRAFGVERLLSCLGMEAPKKGFSYHIMTGSNIDTMSFMKGLFLHKPHAYHVMVSTWVINGEDILQFREWIETGKIDALDVYIGEIFPNQYKVEWAMLRDLFAEKKCGRLCYFSNHAKVTAMDMGGVTTTLSREARTSTPTREMNMALSPTAKSSTTSIANIMTA